MPAMVVKILVPADHILTKNGNAGHRQKIKGGY